MATATKVKASTKVQPDKIVKLYNGSVEIAYYDKQHRYSKVVKGEVEKGWIISVTAATGILDKSRVLMWWATKKLAAPFLKGLLEKKTPITEELIDEACHLWEVEREKAADLGTQIHAWIESYIKAQLYPKQYEAPKMPEDEKIQNGAMAFLRWLDENKVRFIASELLVYSKKYDYVGLMDAKAVVNGRTCVIDFKSSNGVYTDHRYQVAAYQAADEEESKKLYTGDRWIIRLGKETGEFEAHQLGDFQKDFKAFLGLLDVKRREKELAKY